MPFLEPCEDKKILIGQLIVTGIWAVITGVGIYLSPSVHGHGTHQQLGLPPCPSVLLFNRPCPGCGLTTSWTATIHGNLPQAFSAHPLGPLLYLALTTFAVINLYAYIKRLRVDTSGRKWMVGIVASGVVFFGFGLARFFLTDNYAAPNEMANFLKRVAPDKK
ncbi:MAG: DUF2752 domain-containing protein [Chlorobia bacterium]|nr:DUF2752 domain-containing protein [Fimbriimonadaceae bacterium]